MAREFIGSDAFYSSKNFNQGAIRRVVTIGTPHKGSGFASMLRFKNFEINNCINFSNRGLATVSFINKFLNTTGKSTVDGAIEYLTYTSEGLRNLNRSSSRGVNLNTIIGDTGDDIVTSTLGLRFGAEGLVGLVGCTADDLFRNSSADGIVPTFSADFDLPAPKSSVYLNAGHLGQGLNIEIAEYVDILLDTDASSFFLPIL